MLVPPRGKPTPDTVLDAFVGYVSAQGLALYPAQEEAILELLGGKHVVLGTPTGSGKSLVAMALHFKDLCQGKRSFYTAPIKALVNEKFFALCKAFGPENVGLITGDASVNKDAPLVCCTAEILSNLALRETDPRVDSVVMDEFHHYADKERGVAWQVPLLLLERAQFLLMSATLGDTREIEERLAELTGREVARVAGGERPVPLEFAYAETPLHETIEDLVAAKKAPVYLVNFTQRMAAEQAQNLMSARICSKEEKEAIRAALERARFDTPYGKELARFLRHGVGLHHAGLLPRYRLLVEQLAQAGHLKVVSGTDTLGAGVNLPIRTVLFTQLCKFDGEKTGILRVRDFLQIAGRAGRRGFDEKGYVVVQAPAHVIENARLAQKEAAGKKVVKQRPPEKGYAHWDRSTFERLTTSPPEPLESRFQVTHGMVLNLLQAGEPERHNGYARLVQLIARSHGNEGSKRRARRDAAVIFRSLRQAGIVHTVPRPQGGRRGLVVVRPDLQRDFSIHTTLVMYLVDTLPRLDQASPSYALDALTVVESILEDPEPILWKQLDKKKGEKLAELKAQGVEYEQRMEELDKLTWPKPNQDFLYATFDLFRQKHPWVGAENVRPKSVAREMVERFMSFHDYVREYGLQRSEGLLLRYLSLVYKTLVQSVPVSLCDEGLLDVIAQLRVTVRSVDSSLLDEWERMQLPGEPGEPRPAAPAAPPPPRDPLADPRAFAARVRAELHALLGALAQRDYERAAALCRGDWTPEALEKEMAPFWEEHEAIALVPDARRPSCTLLTEREKRLWVARQKIWAVPRAAEVLDPEDAKGAVRHAAGPRWGETLWMLDCVVDLRAPREDDGPMIELVRVGL